MVNISVGEFTSSRTFSSEIARLFEGARNSLDLNLVDDVLLSSGSISASQEIANLYKFRIKIGLADPELVLGLKETIRNLDQFDGKVQLFSLDLDKFFLGFWADETTIFGMLLFKKRVQSTPSA
jgi:hypothetical protein